MKWATNENQGRKFAVISVWVGLISAGPLGRGVMGTSGVRLLLLRVRREKHLYVRSTRQLPTIADSIVFFADSSKWKIFQYKEPQCFNVLDVCFGFFNFLLHLICYKPVAVQKNSSFHFIEDTVYKILLEGKLTDLLF